MRPHSRQQTPPRATRSKGRGIVQRELNSITSQLDVRSDWSYELCVVPHWDPSAALIERFDAPTPALLRQAEVARQLRANGWTVIEHGAALGIHEAA
jgi:hypothetical protein